MQARRERTGRGSRSSKSMDPDETELARTLAAYGVFESALTATEGGGGVTMKDLALASHWCAPVMLFFLQCVAIKRC